MSDKTHLKNRNGHWHFQRRRPSGGHERFSLKTKSLKEAQRKRDEYLKEWEVAKEEADAEIRLNKLAREYRASRNDDEREHLSDKAREAAEDFAYKTGVYQSMKEKMTFRPDDELTDAEQAPINRYRHVMGQVHILAELKQDWLESLSKPQRSAYAPALDRLMSKVTMAEQVLPDGESWRRNCIFASEYIETATKEFGLAQATVRKDANALAHLWDWAKLKDPKMWKKNSIPKTPELNKPREAWKNSEVLQILEAARTSNWLPPWMYHVIKIAAYTGARQGAICHPETEYFPKTNEIWFPPLKKEDKGRNIHVHSEIVDSVKFWIDGGRVSADSVRGKFTKFRRSLGYPDTKVFHGFRNTFIGHLASAKYADGRLVEERLISTIVGHKTKGITLGGYNESQATREQIKGVINLMDYTLPDSQEVLGEPRSAAFWGMME